MADKHAPETLFESFKGNVLSSIPAVSVLTFVIVALKVYRAAGMEGSTTVAIVSGADLIALLEGVILTLLPSFLALLISAAIWWWTTRLGRPEGLETPRRALKSFDHLAVWTALAVGFLTLPWPFFVALFIPLLALDLWLWFRGAKQSRTRLFRLLDRYTPLTRLPGWFTGSNWFSRWKTVLLAACVVVGGANVFFLALSSTVWLPLRYIEAAPGETIELDNKPLPDELGAYVLSQDDKKIVLLLDSPRAVVEIAPNLIEPNPPICIPEPPERRSLYLRAVQVVGIEGAPESPYPECP